MADTNLSKANKPSFGTRVKRFFKDTKAELKKVTWPDKEQLIHNTGVIIVFILIITISCPYLILALQNCSNY